MFRLATLTAAAVFALAVGFAGTAWAQTDVLLNGDAEDGSLSDWTATAAVAALEKTVSPPPFPEVQVGVQPFGGDWLFSMGDGSAPDDQGGGVFTASMFQTVPVDGCNVFINDVDLQGTWSFSARYATQPNFVDPADFGTVIVEIFNGGMLSGDTTSLLFSADAWAEVTDGDDLPVGADTATITLVGTVETPSIEADVVYDNVSFIIDCVLKTAKISGKLAADGKRPTHVFGGAVGLLEGGDTAVGSEITVSYKKSAGFTQNTSCTFVEGIGPTAISGDTATLTDWSYTCDDGRDTSGETADITLVDRSGDLPRGSIDIDADDNQLDVSGNLKTGNVIVDDGT